MFLSVFDLFKIGIGPSSSHTVGPMVAAGRFVERLRQQGGLDRVASVRCSLHGSLAWTGKGHASDRAVLLGLAGAQPDTIDPETVLTLVHQIDAEEQLSLGGTHPIGFRRDDHLVFDFGPALPGHANGMIFVAFDAGGDMLVEETYYSIGGGFVSSADELANRAGAGSLPQDDVPFPFKSAKEMLEMGENSGLTIAEMKRQNECAVRPEAEVIGGLDNLWRVMRACINRGLGQDGRLPGGLDVKRALLEHERANLHRFRDMGRPSAAG